MLRLGKYAKCFRRSRVTWRRTDSVFSLHAEYRSSGPHASLPSVRALLPNLSLGRSLSGEKARRAKSPPPRDGAAHPLSSAKICAGTNRALRQERQTARLQNFARRANGVADFCRERFRSGKGLDRLCRQRVARAGFRIPLPLATV